MDTVVALCFDTTSSNTGKWKGSVSLIERRLDRSVMWLACRHHVYELHIKHVAETVLGKRNSPSEGLFRRFKKEWDQLDQDVNGLTLFDYTGISSDCRKQAEHVLSWGEKCLKKNTFPREDYRELLELTVIYLGGIITRNFKLRKPGAHHHARFMAYAIYFLKIELMSVRFQLEQTERKQSKRMAHFISLFHSEAFLRCRLSSISPAQDLRYLRLMQCYREEDRDVADAAIKSILNHLWYVTQEVVVFSLFDSELPADLRRDIYLRK
jgi:hypothetical protein